MLILLGSLLGSWRLFSRKELSYDTLRIAMHSQQEPQNTPPPSLCQEENKADLIWLTKCSEHEKMLQNDSLFWLLLGICLTTEIPAQTSRNSPSKLKVEQCHQGTSLPLPSDLPSSTLLQPVFLVCFPAWHFPAWCPATSTVLVLRLLRAQ